MYRSVAIVVCLAGMLGGVSSGRAATHTIENRTLSVTFDDVAGTFSCAEKASGSVFLTDGRLDGAASKAVVETARDDVFGSGKRIVVKRTDGGIFPLELYEDMPFVLIRGELHNGGQRDRGRVPGCAGHVHARSRQAGR